MLDPKLTPDFATLFPTLPVWAETLVALVLLMAIAALANLIVKNVLLRLVLKVLPLNQEAPAQAIARLTNIVPVVIISRGIALVPHLPAGLVTVAQNVAGAFIVLAIALAISAALTFANDLYQRRPDAADRPIKGYIQVLKIVLFAAAAILMIAVLMEQSPLLLLSGLGAMAAVLMLVFKDTILSLVASVQLTSNDMVRVGDWIEMPHPFALARLEGDLGFNVLQRLLRLVMNVGDHRNVFAEPALSHFDLFGFEQIIESGRYKFVAGFRV